MDPYVLGKCAYNDGQPKTANPYKDLDPKWAIWRAGWRDAQESQDERFQAA